MVAPIQSAVRSHLQDCGYRPGLIRMGIAIPNTGRTALVAYFEQPTDARSACIAVIETRQPNSIDEIAACRHLGAPVVFALAPGGLEFWQQRVSGPKLIEEVPTNRVSKFFATRKRDLEPAAIYRAKTRSRFESSYQLTFVDHGLMPIVEATIGDELSRLVERLVVTFRRAMGAGKISEERGRWIFQTVFWLLAAKILKDKDVAAFSNLNLSNPKAALRAVAAHYRAGMPADPGSAREKTALDRAAQMVATFSSLAHVTTESLAYLYESTLITRQTRRELGTHSTPTFLVDYVVGKLAPMIESIEAAHRDVFEPAAGHAGFLVAAMRLLRSLVPDYSPLKQRQYLREKLHGIEQDQFAVEIGRLSLTLADAPNPNGWDLVPGNMFEGDKISDAAARSKVLLCNPPFEKFSDPQIEAAAKQGRTLAATKAAEVLARALPALPDGAVIGVVVPSNFLHSKNTSGIRELLGTCFEISEITLFPDSMFSFSSAESAIILARKDRPRADASIR